MQFLFKQPTRRTLRWTNLLAGGAVLATGCGQDAHHLASIASKLGRQVATGSERVRETALGRLFQNRSVLEQVPLTDRARIRLRLDRNLNGLEISVRQIEAGCLELPVKFLMKPLARQRCNLSSNYLELKRWQMV